MCVNCGKPVVTAILLLLTPIQWILDIVGRVQTVRDLPIRWVLHPLFPPIAFCLAVLIGAWAYFDFRIKKEPAGFANSPENKRRYATQAILGSAVVITAIIVAPLIYGHYYRKAANAASQTNQRSQTPDHATSLLSNATPAEAEATRATTAKAIGIVNDASDKENLAIPQQQSNNIGSLTMSTVSSSFRAPLSSVAGKAGARNAVPPPIPGMIRCGDGTFVPNREDCVGRDLTQTVSRETRAPAGQPTTVKIVNNFIAGRAFGSDNTDGCKDGKTIAGQPCGVWDVEDRRNTYFNTEGNGLPNTHQQFVEGNKYVGTQSGKKLTIAGEDTTFRNNTVRNMDVEVSRQAQRAVIHDNLFEAESLLAQVNRDNNEQLESVLANMRTAYEERWKSLPGGGYRANEELLAQFEKSAREKPLDREKTRILLQKVIDATPK
jgi:hypothetical protein